MDTTGKVSTSIPSQHTASHPHPIPISPCTVTNMGATSLQRGELGSSMYSIPLFNSLPLTGFYPSSCLPCSSRSAQPKPLPKQGAARDLSLFSFFVDLHLDTAAQSKYHIRDQRAQPNTGTSLEEGLSASLASRWRIQPRETRARSHMVATARGYMPGNCECRMSLPWPSPLPCGRSVSAHFTKHTH